MAYACDGYPVTNWLIAWNAVGPFYVDSWKTSYSDGRLAHRVIGKHGFQCSTREGCVIQFDREYAEAIARAANEGSLARHEAPKNPSARYARGASDERDVANAR
ncbi:hypothetical protein [Lysobacter sp. Hz 25]|uniref:hypothetical protein n=1 Tax=Lysobacter sp. Hz 25 TaxID=3383698 RepID=UPI0038D48361